MVKVLGTEIVAQGKFDMYKDWIKRNNERRKELGMPLIKIHYVMGREAGRVFFDLFGEAETWEAFQKAAERYQTDETFQALEREQAEEGLVVPGSFEMYQLVEMEV